MSRGHSRVQNEPIDMNDVYGRLSGGIFGAQLVFVGVVRDTNNDRKVEAVTYEGYIPLAERVFDELIEEAFAKFSENLKVVLVHRLGTLKVGEISTVVGVAARHRGECYEVSRYLVEELKKRLPVWKEEHYIEGESTWLEGTSLVS